MSYKPITWLLLGVFFWGSAPIVAIGLYQGIPFVGIVKVVVVSVALTGMVTYVVQMYTGGFIPDTAKRWFFVPLFCCIVVVILGAIENSLFAGKLTFW